MVGQYSLMPGQCPGLSGSGYATGTTILLVEKYGAFVTCVLSTSIYNLAFCNLTKDMKCMEIRHNNTLSFYIIPTVKLFLTLQLI